MFTKYVADHLVFLHIPLIYFLHTCAGAPLHNGCLRFESIHMLLSVVDMKLQLRQQLTVKNAPVNIWSNAAPLRIPAKKNLIALRAKASTTRQANQFMRRHANVVYVTGVFVFVLLLWFAFVFGARKYNNVERVVILFELFGPYHWPHHEREISINTSL